VPVPFKFGTNVITVTATDTNTLKFIHSDLQHAVVAVRNRRCSPRFRPIKP
jgi:hypothetical protein